MRWIKDKLYLPIDPLWRSHADCIQASHIIRENGGYARVIRKYNNPQVARTWMRMTDLQDINQSVSPLFPPVREEVYDWNWGTYTFSVHDAWKQIDGRYPCLAMSRDTMTYWYRRCLSWLDHTEDVFPSRLRDKVMVDQDILTSGQVNCRIPILVAFFPQEGKYQPWIIDGWKRLYTAYHQNLPLFFYVLSPDQTAAIVL